MQVASVIAQNLWGYDLVIFLVAVVTGWVYLASRQQAMALYRRLRLVIFLPLQAQERGRFRTAEEVFDVEDFVNLRERAESLYGIFTNLTAIFPLLGILGTVLSLLPMVANMAGMETNFFAALTSTFWGLVFAIIAKVGDAFLAPRIEDNDRNVNLLLSRIREKPGDDQ